MRVCRRQYLIPTLLHRKLTLTFVAVLVSGLGIAWAIAPSASTPAQSQIKLVVASLGDSEAEHADGAYYPGIGAFITMDLLRGPNSVAGKSPHLGTRDWMIYLMKTFGVQIAGVPPKEIIGMSVDYYDYERTVFHQLVMTSAAENIKDETKYTVWLDGKPFEEAVAALAAAPPSTAPSIDNAPLPEPTPPPETASTEPTALPQATVAPPTGTPAPVAATPQPNQPLAIDQAPGNVKLDFKDAASIARDWTSLGTTWQPDTGGYVQGDTQRYDILTYYNHRFAGDMRLSADVSFLEGQMGAGLVFNAPSITTKNNAHMVSYTARGKYLQWGRYDDAGVFQFQGGSPIPDGSDGKVHRIAVRIVGDKYRVSVDGVSYGYDVPLVGKPGGYAGLMASTSRVRFDNVQFEGK